jgi:hypothetical protein
LCPSPRLRAGESALRFWDEVKRVGVIIIPILATAFEVIEEICRKSAAR